MGSSILGRGGLYYRVVAQILVIEDDDLVRRTVRRMLEFLGHRVTEAADGRDALALDRVEPADLVLTDIFMPGMEGVETIRELRRRRPDAKVIAMSGGGGGLGPNDSLRLARLLGAQHTLPKPFGTRQLQEAIRNVLED